MTETAVAQRLRELLKAVKPLAAEYYRLTGKPLGVTGEVAEYVAAKILDLEPAPPRTSGYDAIRRTPEGSQRIEIKGRAYGEDAKPGQRIGRIKQGAACDVVLLVLLNSATLDPREMWEAPYAAVAKRLAKRGSKARKRGQLGVSEFKRLNGASQIWPKTPRSLNEVIAALPASERRKIEARARRLIAEEMSLQALRKAIGKTQTVIAKRLKVGQDAVPKLETRSDMYISTLRSFLKAMSGDLELIVKFPDRPPVRLEELGSGGSRRKRERHSALRRLRGKVRLQLDLETLRRDRS